MDQGLTKKSSITASNVSKLDLGSLGSSLGGPILIEKVWVVGVPVHRIWVQRTKNPTAAAAAAAMAAAMAAVTPKTAQTGTR